MPFHYVEIAEQLLSVYDNESTCYPLYLIVYIYFYTVLQMILLMRPNCARC